MPEIDGLRFIAIFPVVMTHIGTQILKRASHQYSPDTGWLSWIGDLMNYGGLGVNIFFAISGFILVLPFAGHYLSVDRPVNLKHYFARRVNRLEPPYFLVMLLFFVMRIALEGKSASELFPHLLASLFYVHNQVYGDSSTILGLAWSLEIEIQFYILAPLLSRIFLIRSRSLRTSIILIGILVFDAVQYLLPYSRVQLSLLGQIQYFLIGFLAVDAYLNFNGKYSSKRNLLDFAFGLGSFILIPVASSKVLFDHIFPFWILLLFYAALFGYHVNRWFRLRMITTIGGMCYTIYLLHHPFCSAGAFLLDTFRVTNLFSINLLTKSFILFPAIIIACSLYFLAVEKPCMQNDWIIRVRRKTLSDKHGVRELTPQRSDPSLARGGGA